MSEVSTIGLDIAKSVFQLHGVDVAGAVVVRKRVSRAKVLEYFGELPPCLVGIEACPSAHHWGRKLQTLGHTFKLIPPSYVKAYLKRGKNDANDAEAICEAATRPSMRSSDQDDGAADRLDAAPDPAIAGAPAHDLEQCPARALSRTGYRVSQGPQYNSGVAQDYHDWCG
jgi:hypothetical protein